MNSSILVIGDAMVDVKYDCKSMRLSPEAPVPVCLFDKATYSLGGAANVAAQIAVDQPCLFAYINPETSDVDSLTTINRLYGMLKQADVMSVYLGGYNNYIIPEKIRIWARQQVCRLDKELLPDDINIPDLTRKVWASDIADIIRRENVSLVVFSDYNKGTLNDDFIQEIVDFCNKMQVQTILDPKRPTYRGIKGLTIVTPNEAEMEKTILDPDELSKQLGKTFLLHTRGSVGMDLYQFGELIKHEGAHTVEVADTCGAGDTVISFLALSLARHGYNTDQFSIMEAMRHANYAASRTVRHRGSYILNKKEITAIFGMPFTQ
jgi:D-beta-D-heptose 7-phosphate kinase/D-beta-D-heptose 1-phosphate adenosyltransferase